MVDLGGYVIILVETHDKKVKLYGSPAEKADLEVADEILEVNGESLENSTHTDVIAHIHNCIKSRTICLRVKRRTSNKLAKELAENSHVQDAFVIAVEQQAKERLERLSALRKIKPVDMTKLSQQLCDTSPENEENSQIYSAPVAELGSTTNLAVTSAEVNNSNNLKNGAASAAKPASKQPPLKNNNYSTSSSSGGKPAKTPPDNASSRQQQQPPAGLSNHVADEADAGGYVTDEELELTHTVEPATATASAASNLHNSTASNNNNRKFDLQTGSEALVQSSGSKATSPSKEVLIGDSRRSSRASIQSGLRTNGNGKNGLNKHRIVEGAEESKIVTSGDQLTDAEVLAKHKAVSQSLSLKSILDADEMLKRLDRLSTTLTNETGKSTAATAANLPVGPAGPAAISAVSGLLADGKFRRLLEIHNTIQSVQCFQCPPAPLCCDTKNLVQESIDALQSSPLPEAAELLDILNHIQFEELFFAHDKLAERQAALPWAQCVADMWTKDRPTSVTPTPPATATTTATAAAASATTPTSTASTQPPALPATSKEPPSASTAGMANKDVTRVVKILKQNEPLGATVRNEGERVVIGRVVKGGAAERSGELHPGDEVLEVNGLRLKGKSVHDICDRLCQMTGTLTFVIIPRASLTPGAGQPPQPASAPAAASAAAPVNDSAAAEQVYHYRAHFTYNPGDDLYIPCHELGISFQRGDILHVINKDDPNWWQAYRDGEWTQTLAGLIPSLTLQQHRNALQKQKREQDLKEQREAERMNSPARKKASAASSLLCAKKSNKRKRHNSPFKRAAAERFDIPPYEEMALYYPQPNQKRPLILVGPPSIGRHELRLQLLEDTIRFAAAVPHTSRNKGEGEIDAQDYNFVTRSQFEEYIGSKRFVEHGEYDKQYYGTSLDSVRTVINSGKICVLNLQPVSLQILHDSDLKPYVVFLTPPTLQTYRAQRLKYGEPAKEEEYRDSVSIAQEMEESYGHYFDSVIPFDDVDYVFQQLMYEINLLEREPQWVPAQWVR